MRAATSRRILATRCSSVERTYVSGRPDSKISRMTLAARLSEGGSGVSAGPGRLLSLRTGGHGSPGHGDEGILPSGYSCFHYRRPISGAAWLAANRSER